MTRPRILDLFSGGGGAAMGYHRAGFDVVGVDIEPQPHYPFRWLWRNALTLLHDFGTVNAEWGPFDAIHASPPCQAFTRARTIRGREHPDLLTPTRDLLDATGLPWVIENVPGAPMRPDYELCGTTFGLTTRRHRLFEVSWGPVLEWRQPCVEHKDAPVMVFGHGTDGRSHRAGIRVTQAQREVAMGIDWMNRDELSQAIPPAYTTWIGAQLLRHLSVSAAPPVQEKP